MNNEKNQNPIAVLGAGAWGTALALHLARLGQDVRLWSIETDHIEQMVNEHINHRYLPGYPFPRSLHPVAELKHALKELDDILIAVPSVGFRDTLLILKPLLKPNHRIISVTKGLDETSGKLLHEIFEEIIGNEYPYAVLSGPSFAKEVAGDLPTALVVASHNKIFAKAIIQRFKSPTLKLYLSRDLIGVEIGGVAKNVIAIATGISDGLNFGANARCAIIARGLAELTRLGKALGGEAKTLRGLSGLGDLVLTCTDNLSRNRRFGLAVGKGQDVKSAEAEIGQVVEGKRNAELVLQLADKYKVKMPICESVWLVINGKLPAKAAIEKIWM